LIGCRQSDVRLCAMYHWSSTMPNYWVTKRRPEQGIGLGGVRGRTDVPRIVD